MEALHRVCRTGRDSGYYWRERYDAAGGHGAQKYCEYPANLIRIVQRFVLGVDLRLDGSLVLAPTVPSDFWEHGFGQSLAWRDRLLEYRMHRERVTGTYAGGTPQRLVVRWPGGRRAAVSLAAAPIKKPHSFEIRLPSQA